MATQETSAAAPAAPQRPRLKLKPRDPEAAARMEAERQASMGKSPFGNAKPREAVIAGRIGKSEEEVLKQEVETVYKLHLRLSGPQLEEKKAQEARIREAEEAATQEEDPTKRAALEADVAARRAELVDLLAGFEKLTLEAARTGAAPRVSTLRKATQESAEGAAPAGGAPPGTQGGRYHPTQGYHMGRHQAPASEDAVPPSRGFPNGQYGSRGSGYVPRPQGFSDYQQPRGHHNQHQSHHEGEAGSSSSSFSRQGSNAAREDSDAGFYDPVPSFDPAAAAGRGSGGSFGRGGYNNGNRREGGRSNGTGQYYQQQGGSRQYNQGATRSYSGNFGAPPPPPSLAGQGIGGEIRFEEDSFGGSQDRF